MAASVLPFTAATHAQSQAIRELNQWIEAEARRQKIPFCDLHRAVADAHHPDRLRGSPDGLHPDVASYHAMAEAMVACVDRYLTPSPR
jgi:lysophospholipase L1-like esterase